jgi:hypothetical protein
VFKQQVTPLIQIVSTVKGLELVEEALPKPANKFIPEWWRTTPLVETSVTTEEVIVGNVKNCPSFPDYFSKGVIIPMWADTLLKYDRNTNQFSWRTSHPDFSWSVHGNEQFLTHVPFKFFNQTGKFVFKANCPWKIITPPGYSVYQLPLFYHYTNDFTVFPGVIDTDTHHDINQQVLLTADKDEILIKRGTPLVQYVPFKREPLKTEVRYQTEEDKKTFDNYNLSFFTKFPGSKEYASRRKKSERDGR